jgi:hypothetical protein
MGDPRHIFQVVTDSVPCPAYQNWQKNHNIPTVGLSGPKIPTQKNPETSGTKKPRAPETSENHKKNVSGISQPSERPTVTPSTIVTNQDKNKDNKDQGITKAIHLPSTTSTMSTSSNGVKVVESPSTPVLAPSSAVKEVKRKQASEPKKKKREASPAGSPRKEKKKSSKASKSKPSKSSSSSSKHHHRHSESEEEEENNSDIESGSNSDASHDNRKSKNKNKKKHHHKSNKKNDSDSGSDSESDSSSEPSSPQRKKKKSKSSSSGTSSSKPRIKSEKEDKKDKKEKRKRKPSRSPSPDRGDQSDDSSDRETHEKEKKKKKKSRRTHKKENFDLTLKRYEDRLLNLPASEFEVLRDAYISDFSLSEKDLNSRDLKSTPPGHHAGVLIRIAKEHFGIEIRGLTNENTKKEKHSDGTETKRFIASLPNGERRVSEGGTAKVVYIGPENKFTGHEAGVPFAVAKNDRVKETLNADGVVIATTIADDKTVPPPPVVASETENAIDASPA